MAQGARGGFRRGRPWCSVQGASSSQGKVEGKWPTTVRPGRGAILRREQQGTRRQKTYHEVLEGANAEIRRTER